MKRLHIHIAFDDLETSKNFYPAMLGQEPNVLKSDYAKWSLDDPQVNLAISRTAPSRPGFDHLGIQAENVGEMDELYKRLDDASYTILEQKGALCCYAESDKLWAVDPVGVPWEMFYTLQDASVYGSDGRQNLVDELAKTRDAQPG